jgi:UDP-sugar transporter A1/2/3
VIFLDGEAISTQGFFAGYNWVVWLTIIVQAVGGIGTAFSIACADRTAKNSATGVSIILSILGSLSLFDFHLSASVSVEYYHDLCWVNFSSFWC